MLEDGKKKSRNGCAARRRPNVLKAKRKAIALAALHITESLLLELEASELLSPKEIRGLLKDAMTTLRKAGRQEGMRNCTVASDIVGSILEQYARSRP
ncbi:hypothetical protein SJ05684_b50330 (plasmid) [Sinorhizobium sojae CCBAU 05684]|uniref:Uncharacterized protein n=1 Tax=Sinorhizobium sojae CCBAU 05684 TaxID=716928 RepID=A0A249PJX7_9HYPH|nr:hypothetical protein [Sinorhizobium sojae]ASY66015.1 hypothetical protein SJ05684_b50330 [Sinorhizobium sojae CCBAU 05684]